jgi:UTP-glucose-1-phosphate uridylyltransferase
VATKTDFTDDEFEAMQKGVTGAGMLVSSSDRDFTDSFGEATALAKALVAQQEQAPSELIREIASTRGTGFGLTASRQKVEQETVESLRSAIDALSAKAPDETENYRRLVLSVAEAVAASKSGVAPAETAALERVKEALAAA